MIVVNSVCGCAAGKARPGVALALRHANRPDVVATVFAGFDEEATARARGYFTGYRPSSPSIALLQNGSLVYMLERSQIENRDATAIAAELTTAFDRFCRPPPPPGPKRVERTERMPPVDAAWRLLLAAGLGTAIGLEREYRQKPAGLRTNILIALGSALFTIMSISMGQRQRHRDRIAAQIVTGIGFLGGGAILRSGKTVHGMTTAATIWVNAAIGMAAGAGQFAMATLPPHSRSSCLPCCRRSRPISNAAPAGPTATTTVLRRDDAYRSAVRCAGLQACRQTSKVCLLQRWRTPVVRRLLVGVRERQHARDRSRGRPSNDTPTGYRAADESAGHRDLRQSGERRSLRRCPARRRSAPARPRACAAAPDSPDTAARRAAAAPSGRRRSRGTSRGRR